jgi:hypothetical protein
MKYRRMALVLFFYFARGVVPVIILFTLHTFAALALWQASMRGLFVLTLNPPFLVTLAEEEHSESPVHKE